MKIIIFTIPSYNSLTRSEEISLLAKADNQVDNSLHKNYNSFINQYILHHILLQ